MASTCSPVRALVWAQNSNSPFTSALTSAGHLGTSVSVQGFRIAAGAPNSTAGRGANAGVAIVFDSNDLGVTYTRSTFRANGGQARVGGLFGTSVSLSGNTVLVGAPGYHTGAKQNSGNVFVFVNNGGSYTQQASIRPANIANNFAGTAVSLFNDTAAFGAPGNSNGEGAVYVYNRSGTTWTQTAAIADPGNTAGDGFGSSVAQLGAFVVAGAPATNSSATAPLTSSARTARTTVSSTNWSRATTPAGATFGFSASVNAGRALIGAPADGAPARLRVQVPGDERNEDHLDFGRSGFQRPQDRRAYTVNVIVNHDVGGTGTPTGSVHVNDGAGGSCDTPPVDGSGLGSCKLFPTSSDSSR